MTNSESRLFDVHSILDYKYLRQYNRVYYRVVYLREDGTKYPPEDQPLDNLTTCPLLMLNYEMSVFKKYKASMQKKSKDRGHRKKAPIPAFILRSNSPRIPGEYIPFGTERYVEVVGEKTIAVERIVKIKRGRKWTKTTEEVFFEVIVDLRNTPVLIRRPFMEYYYPLDLLKYWSSLEEI
jgi:hypothetical protein